MRYFPQHVLLCTIALYNVHGRNSSPTDVSPLDAGMITRGIDTKRKKYYLFSARETRIALSSLIIQRLSGYLCESNMFLYK